MTVGRRRIFRREAWRRFALFAGLVFLVSQLHAVVHAAEFGGAFHKHHGVPCAVQLLCEAGKSLSAPVPAAALPAPFPSGTAVYALARVSLPTDSCRGPHPIRGPPAFLF